MPIQPQDAARFWSKVHVGAVDACWDWAAGLFSNGYGQFKWQGQSIQAHRIAWALSNEGNVDGARYICHRCDNRKCCNPAHLFNGTARDNAQDAIAKGRREPIVQSRRGERSNWALLTEEQVHTIRRAYAAGGMTYKALAAQFGVTYGAIGRVVRGSTWKHLGDVQLPPRRRGRPRMHPIKEPVCHCPTCTCFAKSEVLHG